VIDLTERQGRKNDEVTFLFHSRPEARMESIAAVVKAVNGPESAMTAIAAIPQPA
jgi:hypothetical protein